MATLAKDSTKANVCCDVKFPGIRTNDSPQTSKNHKSSYLPSFLRREAFRVVKPLVPLKISLFLWYGAGSVINAYLFVFLKRRGVTIAQLSFINMINPLVQFSCPTFFGLVADKIGNSKLVLLANIIMVTLFLNCMMLIPHVNTRGSGKNYTTVECQPQNTTSGVSLGNRTDLSNCTMHCSENVTNIEFTDISGNDGYSWNITVSDDKTDVNMSFDNQTSLWCSDTRSKHCNLVCEMKEPLINVDDNTMLVFLLSLFLLIFFYTTYTNCFRFMDVTTMSMVKTYDSDFGRERIWSHIGKIILLPLSGYLVQKFSFQEGTKDFLVAFYVFDILVILVMITVWKLDVEMKRPGEMMFKKVCKLLKELDFLVFVISLLVLGSSWGYVKVFRFVYLDDLGAASIVFPIISLVSAVTGLPFLFTSNWWVDKFGSYNLIIMGFLGYAGQCFAYSLLVNPWMSTLCETLSVFTSHLLWVAVVRHSHEIAPEGLTATVIATAGGIYYGLGRGTGSLVGGLIMSKYGGRKAFTVVAIISASGAVLLVVYGYFRKRYKKKKTSKETTSNGGQLTGTVTCEESMAVTSLPM